MKIKSDLFTDNQLRLLKENEIIFDFLKDYSDNEIVDFEERIIDAMLKNGIKNGNTTEKLSVWEKIHDIFQDNTN